MPFIGRTMVVLICRTLLLFLIGVILCLLPLPLVLFVIIPSLVYRCLVIVIARIFRPDLASIFGGKGVLFALESVYTKPKLSILLHFIFDGSIPLEKLQTQFQQLILNDVDKAGNLRYPQLRQYWTQFFGFFFWKWDSSFDLKNHIKLLENLNSGVRVPPLCSEDDLKRVTSELLSRPYEVGRSPWELLVAPNYKSSGNTDGRRQTAIVFRVHHAMADGYSILGMWLKLFNQEGAKVPQVTVPKSSTRQKLLRSFLMPFKIPVDVAKQLIYSVDGEHAWHLDAKLERKYHAFYSDRIDVGDLKRIKNKFGVGYNAVVYTVTAGGIRRLMQEAGHEVPKRICCFVPLPFPGHPGGLAVHVSGFCFKFNLTEPSPEKRLIQISKSLQELTTDSIVPLLFSWGVDLFSVLPVWGLRTVYNKMMMTLTMTSFPGPEMELNVMDGSARVVDIIPALGHPPGKMGKHKLTRIVFQNSPMVHLVTTIVESSATAVMVSTAGRQRIALLLDRKLFPQSHQVPQNFAQHINDEVSSLLNSSFECHKDSLSPLPV